MLQGNAELTHWKILYDQLAAQRYTVQEHGFLQPSSYNEARQAARMQWLRQNMHGRVLDIGGGIGKLFEGYATPSVLIDAYPLHVAKAKEIFLGGLHKAYCVDVRFGLPFGDKTFDTAVLAEFLEHLRFSEAVKAVREANRVAGRIVITLPYMCDGDYLEGDVENIEHRWSPTRELANRLIRDADVAASIGTICGDSFLSIVTA